MTSLRRFRIRKNCVRYLEIKLARLESRLATSAPYASVEEESLSRPPLVLRRIDSFRSLTSQIVRENETNKFLPIGFHTTIFAFRTAEIRIPSIGSGTELSARPGTITIRPDSIATRSTFVPILTTISPVPSTV